MQKTNLYALHLLILIPVAHISSQVEYSLNAHTSIRRLYSKPEIFQLLSPREYVVSTTWQTLADGSILIATKSVEEVNQDTIDSMLQRSADDNRHSARCVQGNIRISGYHIQPTPETLSVGNDVDGNIRGHHSPPSSGRSASKGDTNNNTMLVGDRGSKCRVTCCLHIEMQGAIPGWLGTYCLQQVPAQCLHEIKRLLEFSGHNN